jgi:alcohol dehydrogenase
MQAAMLNRIGQPLTIEDIPEPAPAAGDVLVHILASPIIPYMQEVLDGTRHYPLAPPIVPGYGAIGVVEKTGPDATCIQPGRLVLCDPMVRARDDSLSPDSILQGGIAAGVGAQKLQTYFHHGPFAEKMLIPLENAVPLDYVQDVDPIKLCWFGVMLVPYGGFLAANLQPGQVLLINGATGFYGSAGVAVALAMGVECVVAPGRNGDTLDALVRQFGPRIRPVLLSDDETANRRRIAQAAGPIDCMLDIVGQTNDPLTTLRCIMALRSNGTAVFMGGSHANIPVPYDYVMHQNLTIRGQYMYPRYAPLWLMGMLRAGLIDLESFSTQAFPLAQANQAIRYAHDHATPFHLNVITPNPC